MPDDVLPVVTISKPRFLISAPSSPSCREKELDLKTERPDERSSVLLPSAGTPGTNSVGDTHRAVTAELRNGQIEHPAVRRADFEGGAFRLQVDLRNIFGDPQTHGDVVE